MGSGQSMANLRGLICVCIKVSVSYDIDTIFFMIGMPHVNARMLNRAT